MLKDRQRLASYQKAIFKKVHPGDVVVDIGTGSGILAFFAAQAGAAKVYAIEQDADRLEWAKILARKNKIDNIVELIHGRSTEIDLPEKADVIVSETLGSLGIDENILDILADAQKRFLKPNGILIPSGLEIFMFPVEVKTFWDNFIGFWEKGCSGYDFSPVREAAASWKYREDLAQNATMLHPPKSVLSLDFYKDKTFPAICKTEFVADTSGIMHGWGAFFLTQLTQNIHLTNSPKAPATHWQQIFLPLQQPVNIQKGDLMNLQLDFVPKENDVNMTWMTSFSRNGKIIVELSSSCSCFQIN